MKPRLTPRAVPAGAEPGKRAGDAGCCRPHPNHPVRRVRASHHEPPGDKADHDPERGPLADCDPSFLALRHRLPSFSASPGQRGACDRPGRARIARTSVAVTGPARSVVWVVLMVGFPRPLRALPGVCCTWPTCARRTTAVPAPRSIVDIRESYRTVSPVSLGERATAVPVVRSMLVSFLPPGTSLAARWRALNGMNARTLALSRSRAGLPRARCQSRR